VRRFLLLFLILTGVMCGLTAMLFHQLVEMARTLLIGRALTAHEPLRFALILGIPAIVNAALAFVVVRWAPASSGANLARVRRAYEADPALLDTRTIAATLFLTPISLGAGMPLGPEGPTVVVASGVATKLARVFKLPRRMVRGMIPVGTAAGIAAIFNTPITGVVFAFEEITGTASRGVLGGAIIAAVSAAVVERMLLGGRPLLASPTGAWTDIRELIGFLFAGVVAGAVSGYAIVGVKKLRRMFERGVTSPVLRATLGGLAVGAIGLWVPDILGVGYGTTSEFLHGGGTTWSASTAFAAKVIAFVIALASGAIGGTFAPSLFIGASLGAAIGHGTALFLPHAHIEPAAYALVGMGAFFAGLLRCPISAVLIVFEVTGDYGLILPLMLAVAVATSLSRWIVPKSMTESQMEEEGHVERRAQSDPLAGATVADVMTRDPLTLTSDMTLGEAARRVAGQRHRFYPIVDAGGTLVGLLPVQEMEKNVDEKVTAHMHVAAYVARADDEVLDVIRDMGDNDVYHCAVVDDARRVIGFLSPSDLLRARMKRSEVGEDSHWRDFDILSG
jgi:chloride channel protein, CIC family